MDKKACLLKQKELINNTIKEIEKLDLYKDFKLGEIYETDDCGKVVNMLYIHPSITKEGWAVCMKLTKTLSLPKTTSGIIKIPVSNLKNKVGSKEVTINEKGEITIGNLIYGDLIG